MKHPPLFSAQRCRNSSQAQISLTESTLPIAMLGIRTFFVRCRGGCTVILCYRLQQDSIDHMGAQNKDIWVYRPNLRCRSSCTSIDSMIDQPNDDPNIRPISRFSTSTSIRMASTHGPNVEVVPMPKWSRFVGFARVALAILVLAFTAATTSIWGIFPALGVALFTVRLQTAGLHEKVH